MSGMSISTIKSPEFINITSINPLISKCEIKVLYLGGNRNSSYITKEVATDMAQSLPGTPIVGYYSENKEDFGDHGQQMVIDGDGIKFNCLTKPYGFVDINTKVWFKEFEDTDEFGNKTLREYLMCEGYLWTEQYEEAKKVINEGRPHSMELDENTLQGHWSEDKKSGLDFFIINDAIFSKLCILGEDVEPCFEGSSVTSPNVSASFSCNQKDFTTSLFKMMKELKEFTLSNQNEGGESMQTQNEVQNLDQIPVVDDTVVENNFTAEGETVELVANDTVVEENNTVDTTVVTENNEENEISQDNSEQTVIAENNNTTEEFTKVENAEAGEEPVVEPEAQPAADYEALENKYNELEQQYSLLKEQNESLLQFKKEVEDKQKDELISKFYMLSDEDKKNVVDNKSALTLDEIEKELSVICFRKKVTFGDSEGEDNKVITSYNLNTAEQEDLPSWLQAVENNKR